MFATRSSHQSFDYLLKGDSPPIPLPRGCNPFFLISSFDAHQENVFLKPNNHFATRFLGFQPSFILKQIQILSREMPGKSSMDHQRIISSLLCTRMMRLTMKISFIWKIVLFFRSATPPDVGGAGVICGRVTSNHPPALHRPLLPGLFFLLLLASPSPARQRSQG